MVNTNSNHWMKTTDMKIKCKNCDEQHDFWDLDKWHYSTWSKHDEVESWGICMDCHVLANKMNCTLDNEYMTDTQKENKQLEN